MTLNLLSKNALKSLKWWYKQNDEKNPYKDSKTANRNVPSGITTKDPNALHIKCSGSIFLNHNQYTYNKAKAFFNLQPLLLRACKFLTLKKKKSRVRQQLW